MKVQYCHDRFLHVGELDSYVVLPKGGMTVAMEVAPTWFFDSLKEGDFFEKKVGIAKCSLQDNYNRKIGREISFSRMKNTRLTVVMIEPFPDFTSYLIQDTKYFYYFKKTKTGRIYFLGVLEK